MRILSIISISFAISFGACGGGGTTEESFDTLEDCYMDHTDPMGEGLTPAHAITVCCIDHPIGTPPVANVVCGETAQACDSFVTAQLDGDGVAAADITAACTDYINQRGN